MKPGLTIPRLFAFLFAVAVLAVVAEHFASGTYPSRSECRAKEIDTGAHKQGTCTEGSTTIVVVNRHSTLKLESLEARLLGTRVRRTIKGPDGSKAAKGEFVTFDLAITNRTDSPAGIYAGQFMLLLEKPHGEDVEVDERYEPRSFLGQGGKIPPHATEDGTVTFTVSPTGAAALDKDGNLDTLNLGRSISALEPEAFFSAQEYGVIRTYK